MFKSFMFWNAGFILAVAGFYSSPSLADGKLVASILESDGATAKDFTTSRRKDVIIDTLGSLGLPKNVVRIISEKSDPDSNIAFDIDFPSERERALFYSFIRHWNDELDLDVYLIVAKRDLALNRFVGRLSPSGLAHVASSSDVYVSLNGGKAVGVLDTINGKIKNVEQGPDVLPFQDFGPYGRRVRAGRTVREISPSQKIVMTGTEIFSFWPLTNAEVSSQNGDVWLITPSFNFLSAHDDQAALEAQESNLTFALQITNVGMALTMDFGKKFARAINAQNVAIRFDRNDAVVKKLNTVEIDASKVWVIDGVGEEKPFSEVVRHVFKESCGFIFK